MMKIYTQIEDIPILKNACITIGSFDGVHKGHLKVIQQLLEESKKNEGTSIVITFYPHPKSVLSQNNQSITPLNTLEEKTYLLEKSGIDVLVIITFTKEFSEMNAEQYISDFLVKYFQPKSIVIGYDHKFGKNRTGNFDLLKKYSILYNFKLHEISEHLLNEIKVSSTIIREKIATGQIEIANELLGYTFNFSGKVIKGNQLGRTIGFPTANIQVNDTEKIIPGNGVYAVLINKSNDSKTYKGMMNIGLRPTIDGKKLGVEVHIFDFSENIYDQEIQISVFNKIREEIKFNNLDELKIQLHRDMETVLSLL